MGKYRSPFDKASKVTTTFKQKGTIWSIGYHTGVDLIPTDGSKNPKLYAIANCTILSVNACGASYGNHIVGLTPDGYVFLMAHMRDYPLVKKGQSVKAGQQVGVMGNTGNSYGEHLHIELENSKTWQYAKNLIDPTKYIDLNKYSNTNCVLSSKIDDFISEAIKHIGETGTWTWNTMQRDKGTPWCALFVCACAKQVGNMLNYVIYNSPWVKGLVEDGVNKKYGTYYKGPFYGNQITPQVGDLITFGWTATSDGYDHIGIVTSVSNNSVSVVEGNSGNNGSLNNKVKQNTYNLNNTTISGYYRSDWGIINADAIGDNSNIISSPLYDQLNDRNDMTLREIGYLNSKNQPSINTSNIGLVVINYTTMLYNIFEVLGYNQTISTEYDISNLSSGPKNVINFLLSKGLNEAASVGIAANIKHESGFRTDLIEYGYTLANGGCGICQWTNSPRNNTKGRRTNMINFVGDNWKSNLTGQLEFLWSELSNSYKSNVLIPLQNVSNTLSGAKEAADIFVRKFEIPANVDNQSTIRQTTAEEYWNKLVPQSR